MNNKKWFLINIIIAIIAAFFAIQQEVWLGTDLKFIEAFALGSFAGICLSFAVEMAKKVFTEIPWVWKNVISGSVCGILVALIVSLFI